MLVCMHHTAFTEWQNTDVVGLSPQRIPLSYWKCKEPASLYRFCTVSSGRHTSGCTCRGLLLAQCIVSRGPLSRGPLIP